MCVCVCVKHGGQFKGNWKKTNETKINLQSHHGMKGGGSRAGTGDGGRGSRRDGECC